MRYLWVDANVLLRLLTGDPPDLAEKALRLAQQAERLANYSTSVSI